MEQLSVDDLARSGLVHADMGIVEAVPSHFAAVKVPVGSKGYVIPYYDLKGDRIPFYRLRLFNAEVKYKQPMGTGNHIYFPPQFKALADAMITNDQFIRPFIILTEGEKKAAAVCKAGLPCVSIGGVDSWRNRTLILSSEVKFDKSYEKMGQIRVKLPAGEEFRDDATLATGMQGLIDFCAQNKADLIVIYDTDTAAGVKMEVQRAASNLAYQLLYLGLTTSSVRQVVLPFDGKKVGLDDFLVSRGVEPLIQLIKDTQELRNAFPRHPNARALINQKLQFGKLDRKELQEVSLSILADLDAKGRRLRSETDGTPYYFDDSTHTLMGASLLNKNGEVLHESSFGTHLYRNYGISGADTKVIQWLAAQFTGEEPVSLVEPRRVTALAGERDEEVAIQISDNYFAVVSADVNNPLRIYSNGAYGMLFEQGQVAETDAHELREEFKRQMEQEFTPWWYTVFKDHVGLAGGDEAIQLISLLYYISPFLLRWRGTQLPVELLIGEPGSGKSSVFELRLSILTGIPLLRNIPTDLRDWFASIINTGGIHVVDNVQFTNKELRQRMSDEICRIITEPNPHVEMRKLFTTSGQNTYPVNTVFAMTAIQQPFYNNDIIQRGAIFEMTAVKGGHQSTWVKDRIDQFGGRTAWLAHQMIALHKFMVMSNTSVWSKDYRATHRLANYEQALQTMARVCGMDPNWIGGVLSTRTQRTMADADWTLEGIKEYVQDAIKQHKPKAPVFGAGDIARWAEQHEEHMHNPQLTNSRSLGRYMIVHKSILEKITGMREHGTQNNRKIFTVGPNKTS